MYLNIQFYFEYITANEQRLYTSSTLLYFGYIERKKAEHKKSPEKKRREERRKEISKPNNT